MTSQPRNQRRRLREDRRQPGIHLFIGERRRRGRRAVLRFGQALQDRRWHLLIARITRHASRRLHEVIHPRRQPRGQPLLVQVTDAADALNVLELIKVYVVAILCL